VFREQKAGVGKGERPARRAETRKSKLIPKESPVFPTTRKVKISAAKPPPHIVPADIIKTSAPAQDRHHSNKNPRAQIRRPFIKTRHLA